jgi:hypothetical protein
MLQRNNVRQSQKSTTSYSSRGFAFFSTAPSTPNYYAREQTGAPARCRTLWANLRAREKEKKQQNHHRPMHGKHIMSHRRTYDAVHKRIPPRLILCPSILHVRGSVVSCWICCAYTLLHNTGRPGCTNLHSSLKARTAATKEMGGRKSVGDVSCTSAVLVVLGLEEQIMAEKED